MYRVQGLVFSSLRLYTAGYPLPMEMMAKISVNYHKFAFMPGIPQFILISVPKSAVINAKIRRFLARIIHENINGIGGLFSMRRPNKYFSQ